MTKEIDKQDWNDWNERMYGEKDKKDKKSFFVINSLTKKVVESFFERRMAEIWLDQMINKEEFEIIGGE